MANKLWTLPTVAWTPPVVINKRASPGPMDNKLWVVAVCCRQTNLFMVMPFLLCCLLHITLGSGSCRNRCHNSQAYAIIIARRRQKKKKQKKLQPWPFGAVRTLIRPAELPCGAHNRTKCPLLPIWSGCIYWWVSYDGHIHLRANIQWRCVSEWHLWLPMVVQPSI